MSFKEEYRVYKDDPKLDRRGIEAELKAYAKAADHRERSSGLPRRLRWYDNDPPFDTFEEADNFIELTYVDEDKYACVAVKFYEADPEALKTDKQYMDLLAKKASLKQKYDSIENALYVKGLKAKTVTCKKCGCGIPTAWWNSNFCPVCRFDLRPENLKKIIAKGWTDIMRLDNRLIERRNAIAKKSRRGSWLIRFVYYT